jgi:dinuclear metal center YbgI/SA1388 family protein
MAKAYLKSIVDYCDRTLRITEMQDSPNALNGLQFENDGRVTRIAAAVDGSIATVKLAIGAKADLLIVHHGMFWSLRQPWTGKNRELIGLLVENNLAVYSCHLPLDSHPRLGNNAQLCALLGLKKKMKPFWPFRGANLGFKGELGISRYDLVQRLERATGAPVIVVPGGPEMCKRIGVVTGEAGDGVKQAAEAGIDTFITGEGPHWTHGLAEELGVNILYGGHYATETFGVKALAAELSKKFKLPWSFLHHPSGL